MLRGRERAGWRRCRVRRRQGGFDWTVQRQKTDRPGSPYRLFDSIKPTYSIYYPVRPSAPPSPCSFQVHIKGETRAYCENPSVTPNETRSYLVSTSPRERTRLFSLRSIYGFLSRPPHLRRRNWEVSAARLDFYAPPRFTLI